MENKGLLFIPDISGFTRFVNESEIEHSRLIIQELLETIINANQIGLEISEIEGDAILFYKYGDTPDIASLYKQVEKMFCEFHRNLITYEYRRLCQCEACTSAIDLSLKVITHYGEFTDYHVKNFKKLIGKDIIVAHQLLKNDIVQHEYWLVTPPVAGNDKPGSLTSWMEWNRSVKPTDGGEIPFYYTQLSQLKNELPPDRLPQLELRDKSKVMFFSKEYETDIITLFHATGDFNFRSRWQDGVRRVEGINHFLPRVGTRCRLVMEEGEAVIYNSSFSFHPERISFSETDEKKQQSVYYLLEKITDDTTRLTVDFYMTKNILKETLFKMSRKNRMEASFHRSLENLAELVKQINFRVEPASVKE